MYEDDNGGWRRLDGHLGGTAADDGSSGCIAVSAGSGIPRGREGAGNHDGLSASSLSRSHEDLDPPDDYLGKEVSKSANMSSVVGSCYTSGS